MSVSQDGKVVLLSAGLKMIVAEQKASDWSSWTLRFNQTFFKFVPGSGFLSEDASILAFHCYQGVCVHRYNPTNNSYDLMYQVAPYGTLDVGEVSMNAKAGLLVVTSEDDNQGRLWTAAAYNLSTGDPLWSFVSQLSSGVEGDTVASLSITDDGKYVAVGTWGDNDNLNPQLHVFQGIGGNGVPLLAYVCPGSVTYVHVKSNPATSSAVVMVLGLQQHQNQGMIGGLAFSLTL